MIQLERIQIEEFRGIRSIDLLLSSMPFVVYGPNGSGKSGIVDGIDFALTGSIARLTGEGTAGVTVQRHAPHVHKRDDPGAAKVSLTVKDTDTGATAVLSRSVKNAGVFTLVPDTPKMRAALTEAMEHPELSLSRRELIKYIVAKPGERAAEVQALLKLEQIDSIRKSLKTASSKATSEERTASSEQGLAEQSFQQHLGLTSLLSTEVLREINARRATLQLSALEELKVDTDLLIGSADTRKNSAVDLTTSKVEVAALQSIVADDSPIREAYAALAGNVAEFRANPGMMDAIHHRELLNLGLSVATEPRCPLCELTWESTDELRAHIEQRIAETEVAAEVRSKILAAAAVYGGRIRQVREAVDRVLPTARTLGPGTLPHLLSSWRDRLLKLEGLLSAFEAITAEASAVSESAHASDGPIQDELEALAQALRDVPDESAEEAARSFLNIAKDRWGRVRAARAGLAQASKVKAAATAAYELYSCTADDALTNLYKSVEADFSRYYQFVNSDDEGAFRAELLPSSGSLDLKVDFYQLGMFPPVAYHSEGHQDGMGVCLYLALVKQLLGPKFRYAVLDDVVMSVDASHRRRFAELLQGEFPDVQFVITTHDEVWARQMRTAGLVTSSAMARFYGWSVDSGPTYGVGDVWSDIDAAIQAGDISGAAAKLRRALEANLGDIAEGIRSNVAYRSDASYDLGTFLISVTARHKELLGRAGDAAKAWSNQSQLQSVQQLQAQRSAVISEQNAEQWLLNKLVHNNDWANGTEGDFRPVLDAAKEFLDLFKCSNPTCGSWITLSGDALRCACQTYNLNLRKK